MQIIKHLNQVVILSLGLLLSITSVSALAGTGFMHPPLKGQWQPVSLATDKSNCHKARLEVQATSDLELLKVELELPAGVKIKQGKLQHQLTGTRQGQVHFFDYSFELNTKKPEKIIANLILADEQGFKQSMAVVLLLNPEAKVKAKTRVVKDHKGDKLIVY